MKEVLKSRLAFPSLWPTIETMELLPLPLGKTDEAYDIGNIFTILPEDRRRHMAIFGQTNTGKTTLMRNMICWDIHEGLARVLTTFV